MNKYNKYNKYLILFNNYNDLYFVNIYCWASIILCFFNNYVNFINVF